MEPHNDDADVLTGAPDEPSFEWKEYYHAVRERLWLVFLIVAVALGAAGIYLVQAPVRYGARAVIQIEPRADQIVRVQEVKAETATTLDIINTLVETVASRSVLQRVVERLALDRKPEFTGGEDMNPELALAMLRKGLKVTLRKNTRLVNIELEHSDPEIAPAVVNAIAEEFVRHGFEQRAEANRMANQFLFEEAERLREKVRKSESALQDYRSSQNALDLEQNQNVLIVQLQDLNSKLSAARADRVRLEADLTKAKEFEGKPEELIKLTSVAEHPKVALLRNTLAKAESEMAVLAKRYGPKHPRMIGARAELENLAAQVDQAAIEAGRLISVTHETALNLEQKYEQSLAQQQKAALELDKKAVNYNVLKRELESDQAVYMSVLERLKEVDLTKGLDTSLIRIVEKSPGAWPIKPDMLVTLGLALAGGLGAGVGLSLLLHRLDTSIRTVDQAERFTGLSVLTAIPVRARRRRKRGKGLDAIPMVGDTHGSIAESFRTLRASIELVAKGEQRKSILFTSAVPAEGKTFNCVNFAVALAQQGLRTLLIDADLRRPSVAQILLGNRGGRGLAECLVGVCPLADATVSTGVPGLHLLPAGAIAPNPAELLAGPGFPRIIEEAAAQYDRVVVDTPPVIAVSDVLLIAPHVDRICMIIRTGKTPRKLVQRALKELGELRINADGVVLNFMPVHGGRYYYYYYYHGGYYGRKGVYGAPGGRHTART